MPRHRFDPVAFVLGAVFVAAGAIVLAGGELIEEGRALVPAGLIALGVALLVHVGRRARPPAPAGATTEIAVGPTDATDVDITEVAPTDATDVAITEVDATDATEVVDPTERYPRPEPD
ncbi:MAG: hypothetical protein ACRD07_22685 [Acidimicrobiales bacterium]